MPPSPLTLSLIRPRDNLRLNLQFTTRLQPFQQPPPPPPPQQQQPQHFLHRCHASTTTSSSQKPRRVLEPPSRFVPPSHPSRYVPNSKGRARIPVTYPGPRLSSAEKEAQKTRKYPSMFPPEGTFMHWFLSNRAIHIWITMSVLGACAAAALMQSFYHETPFKDDLPPARDYLNHPIRSTRRLLAVYRVHVEHRSAEIAERRRKNVEDVRKRSEFRKAHGLEGGEEESGAGAGAGAGGVLGGWSFRRDGAVGAVRDMDTHTHTQTQTHTHREGEGGGRNNGEEGDGDGHGDGNGNGNGNEYRDWEGKTRRRPVKKWLGIWS